MLWCSLPYQMCCGVHCRIKYVVVFATVSNMLWYSLPYQICCGIHCRIKYVVVFTAVSNMLWYSLPHQICCGIRCRIKYAVVFAAVQCCGIRCRIMLWYSLPHNDVVFVLHRGEVMSAIDNNSLTLIPFSTLCFFLCPNPTSTVTPILNV